MKYLYLTIFAFISLNVFSQKVFYTQEKADATLIVYEVDLLTDADIVVKKINDFDELGFGFWKEVTTLNEAEVIVYLTDENTTDVKKVYFTRFIDEVNYLID
jgi:hypothetical protein